MPRIALLVSGHPRGMDILNDQMISLTEEIDIFVFSWDQVGMRGTEDKLDAPTVRESLNEFYSQHPRIKKYVIESNSDYVKKNPIDPKIKFFRFSRTTEINIKSQLYAIKRSYELMEEYAKENGITYDVVVKTRFEMSALRFVIDKELIAELNENKLIFVPDEKESYHKHPYISHCYKCEKLYGLGARTAHIFAHGNIICDTYAYGSMQSMKEYCSLHDKYEKLCKQFEKHNVDTIDRLPIPYTKDGEVYVIDPGMEYDKLSQDHLFCAYPEKLFQYALEGYMLPASRKIVLRWME